jgi:Outer membrane lipoprotein carrier protein LolA-like
MISGPRNRPALAALLAVVLALWPVATWAEDGTPRWGLADLMADLSRVPSGTARFVEHRYLRVTTAPLQSSGILRYVAPDRLEKQTLLPQPGRLTIAGDRLTVERQGEPTRVISLQERPEIGALVAGMRATMAGDLPTLTRFYATALTGNAAHWQLDLSPRDPHVRELVSVIRITGSGTALTRVETLESDGDRTDMAIDATPQ